MNTKKFKLIIISGFYPIFKGGAEYQMRLIADQLNDQFEIVFIYLGDIPGFEVAQSRYENIDGYKVYFLKSPTKIDQLFLRFFYSKRLFKILKEENPDFVYQRVYKFISYYISKFQKTLKFQHFIHIADLFTIEFKANTLRNKLNFKFFKNTAENESKFIVQTAEQEEILSRYDVKPVLQVYNMHPIVDLNIQYIASSKQIEKKKHIVWVANIKPIKQLEIFLELATSFQNNDDVEFDIIGSVQDTIYANPLLEKIKTLNNVNHYTDKDNVFVNEFLLNNAFLVINTSKSEGFSNVFIQSWLRGIPVISLNSNPDNLFDKFSEFGKYCNNSIELLENYVVKMIDNDEYFQKSINCYERSRELFSFKNIEKIKRLLK